MDAEKLAEFNPWRKGKELIAKDFDILRLNERKYLWMPDFLERIEIKSQKTVSAYIETLSNMFALIVLHNIDVSSKRIRFGRN